MSLSEVQKQSQNVSEVTPEKENWNIIVRVIRSWFVPDFSKQRCTFSMELVIQDKENNESPSQGLTQLSQTSKHTVEEDFLTLTPRTTIQGLKDCKEVTTYILFGTIKHILGEDDWWYTACVCNKAVYPYSKMFFCEKCNKHVIKVFPRYRIKIRVIDSSDSTTFVLFDRDATTLFKKTCADMLDTHDKMNASGNLPKEFDELVDKSLLFKVESRNDHTFKLEQSFRVKKVCVDDDIFQKFNDSSMKSVDVYAVNGEFSGEKQCVVNESIVDIAEDLLARFTKEIIECESQSLDLIKDNATNDDGNSSLKRESAKKTASLESIEEDTVPLKLLKRNIKKEKLVI
ncbi:Replication factor A [Vigna unguiculata]|uniref:Replication factor A n=1 Tax=Vigna unguiculata TaxID=3917 RepID=A0A4D6M1W1_VIGUN|nr:Replication factor A [Vigna unguiculata]